MSYIDVPNPDDPHGSPAYDGPADNAWTRLNPGHYKTSNGDVLVVEGNASYLAITDPIFPPLVAVETAERYAARALAAINAKNLPETDAIDHARVLLLELLGYTSAASALAVRDQVMSDAISARATEVIRKSIGHMDPEHREIAEKYSRLSGKYDL